MAGGAMSLLKDMEAVFASSQQRVLAAFLVRRPRMSRASRQIGAALSCRDTAVRRRSSASRRRRRSAGASCCPR